MEKNQQHGWDGSISYSCLIVCLDSLQLHMKSLSSGISSSIMFLKFVFYRFQKECFWIGIPNEFKFRFLQISCFIVFSVRIFSSKIEWISETCRNNCEFSLTEEDLVELKHSLYEDASAEFCFYLMSVCRRLDGAQYQW